MLEYYSPVASGTHLQGIAGGPNGGWEFLYKYSPATQTMLQANKHIEDEFGVNNRGSKHSSPDKEGDIKKLAQSYEDSKIFDNRDRLFPKKMKTVDMVKTGSIALQRGPYIKNWNEKRVFPRSTEERPFETESNSPIDAPSATASAVQPCP